MATTRCTIDGAVPVAILFAALTFAAIPRVAAGVDVNRLCERGNRELKDSRWGVAAQHFTEALQRDPTRAAAYVGRGRRVFTRMIRMARSEITRKPSAWRVPT